MSTRERVDVKEVLRSYGWECGPKFDRAYLEEPWIFNLVNIIERQAQRIQELERDLADYEE